MREDSKTIRETNMRHKGLMDRWLAVVHIFDSTGCLNIVDLFWNWYNSFIYQGVFYEILYGSSKLILLCSGEDSIYSSTPTASDVIMASNCICDIFFSSTLLKTHMALLDKIISVRTFSALHFKETNL